MQFKRIITAIIKNKHRAIGWFVLLMIVQSFFTIYNIVRIPIDPKNIAILGLTRGRIALIILIIGIDILGFVAWNYFSKLKDHLKSRGTHTKTQQFLQSSALFLMFVFWITIWLPEQRLGEYSEEFERLRPFLLWLGAVGCELFSLIRIFSLSRMWITQAKKDKRAVLFNKTFLFSILITLCFAGLYFYLGNHKSLNSGIVEPASLLITPLQLFLLWIIVIFVCRMGRNGSYFSRKKVILITLAFLFILNCIIFLSMPMACEGDWVGIYPPNYTCYPDIEDAVFHVGSLYTYYGEGILNQWFTDKPIYMLFLSLCQWIVGNQLQGYMSAQVVFLSLIPAAIFLLTFEMADYPGALLASLLSIVAQYNSVHLYSVLGGVNIRIVASEPLTSLLLIFTTRAIIQWFRQPNKLIFALMAGLVLGLTTLTRFNAIVIIPVMLVIIAISYIKNKRKGLFALASFGAGLAITLVPWFFLMPVINHDIQNPYLEKIQTIIILRTEENPGSIEIERTPAITITETGQINKNPSEQVPVTGSLNDPAQGFLEKVSLHFSNNLLSAFFSLPVNSTFYDPYTITEQSFWNRDEQPIWQREMSPENLASWCFSIFLFIWGIRQNWRRWGLGGLLPLIVFLSYLLGNAFSLTSGGRYLIPVMWVVFFYCALGILQITKMIFLKLGFTTFGGTLAANGLELYQNSFNVNMLLNKGKVQKISVVIMIFIAIVLPFLQIIPDKLPLERTRQTEQLAYTYIQNDLDPASWEAFLMDPNSVIVEGVLFFPQYYNQSRNPSAFGTNVFEAMVLGKDYFYTTYLWNQKPDFITDGSEVLVVGCKQEGGPLWGMERVVVRAYSIIQLDNEEAIYIDPQAAWTCR